MKRRLLTFALALGAMGFLVAPPAQAASKTEGTINAGWDMFGESGGGITFNAFTVACQQGRAADFLGTPLNGLDGFAVDLGSEKMGAFAVKGPGASAVGPFIPVAEIQLTTYDLDLHFLTTDCEDANATESGQKCYSQTERPDEATSCIKGFKAGGKVHGARYVIVTMASNFGGVPVDFVLTHP